MCSLQGTGCLSLAFPKADLFRVCDRSSRCTAAIKQSEKLNAPPANDQKRRPNRMSEQNEELLQQYKSSLDDLRVNSRPMIQMLTMLADENKHVAATGIVKLIENEIWSVSTERKLIYLYLVD